ncbi:MAG: hypothetical protein JSV62_04745 [Promethearchaeota archaeon]|nr:MAG: hypothetical protein JSV62_04745 [Candidatus Lokiarchaeota archaeon]
MLDELLLFIGVYIISLGMSGFLMSDRAGVLKPIALRIFFIGVLFHEVAHYGISLVSGKIPEKISIKWRHEEYGVRYPHGSVKHFKPPSFLQAVLISFAPLYLSTWLIFFLWFGVIFSPFYDPIIKTISIFFLFSLLLTASPSSQDIVLIGNAFKTDQKNSLYQILLIVCSSLILLSFLTITQIVFLLDFFYYIAIAGIYLSLKFSILGIRRLIISLQNHKKPQKISLNLSRKRYKPINPRRENE